jgi:hypothetical protein
LSRGKSLRSQWYSSLVLIVEESGEIVADLDSDQVQSNLKLLSNSHLDLFGADCCRLQCSLPGERYEFTTSFSIKAWTFIYLWNDAYFRGVTCPQQFERSATLEPSPPTKMDKFPLFEITLPI